MMLRETVLMLVVGVVFTWAYPGLYLPAHPVLVAPKEPIIRHQLVPIGTILKTYPSIVSTSRQLLFQQRFGRKLNCTTPATTTTSTTTMTPATEADMNSVLMPTTEELPTTTSAFQEETTEVPETTTTATTLFDVEEKVKIETTTTPNEVEEVTDFPEATTELPQLKVLEVDLPSEVDNEIADALEMTTASQLEWDEKDNELDAVLVKEDKDDDNVEIFEDREERQVDDRMESNDDEINNTTETVETIKETVIQEPVKEEEEGEEGTSAATVNEEKEEEGSVLKKEEGSLESTFITTVNVEKEEGDSLDTPSTLNDNEEEGSGGSENVASENVASENLASENTENNPLPVEVNEMAETEQKSQPNAQFDLPENLLNSYSSAFFHRFADSPFLNIQQHPIQIPGTVVPSSPSNGAPLIKSYRPLLHTAAYTAALHPLPVFKKTTTTTTVEQHHHPQHFIHTHDGVALNYAPALW